MAQATDDAPPPVGVGHMTLTVADLEASHRFYLDLGLRPLGRGDGIAILELRGGTHLLLFQRGGAEADTEGDGPFDNAGVQSVDLMLAGRSLEDLSHFRQDLIDKGYQPDPIPDRRFFGHYVFKARDPDGHEVTVSTSHASEHPI
jgi:catechol 2,3-dioxygenase-like lactoylglutathione lyase family enzyme